MYILEEYQLIIIYVDVNNTCLMKILIEIFGFWYLLWKPWEQIKYSVDRIYNFVKNFHGLIISYPFFFISFHVLQTSSVQKKIEIDTSSQQLLRLIEKYEKLIIQLKHCSFFFSLASKFTAWKIIKLILVMSRSINIRFHQHWIPS